MSSILPIIKLTPYEQNKYEEKKKQEENYDDIDEEKLWKEVEEANELEQKEEELNNIID